MWTTAFVLLAATLIVGAGGAAAISASLDSTETTYTAAHGNNSSVPPVVTVGREAGSSIATLLPLLGWAMVPLGLVGVLGLGLNRATKSPTAGRARR